MSKSARILNLLPGSSSSGFTFVELLISVSIISLIASAAIPGFSNYMKRQDLRQSAEQIKSDIRSAQINALAGAYSDVAGADFWALHFPAGFSSYSIYTCANTDTVLTDCVQRGEAKTLQGNTVFLDDSADDYIFVESKTGMPFPVSTLTDCSGSNCVATLFVEGLSCTTVSVNPAGGIFIAEGVSCP